MCDRVVIDEKHKSNKPGEIVGVGLPVGYENLVLLVSK